MEILDVFILGDFSYGKKKEHALVKYLIYSLFFCQIREINDLDNC